MVGLVLGLIVCAGCDTPIHDARGASELCEVHHTLMRSELVPAPKGNDPLPPDYVQAGLQFFPHAYPVYKPSKHDRLMIFICDDCVRAQMEWRRQHPGELPQ